MNPARSPRPRSHLRVVPPPRDDEHGPSWIEISLSWGSTPLHVEHLREASGYVLADALDFHERGFVVAAPTGEPPRRPIVIERDGAMFAVVPDDTSIALVVDGRVLFRREAERSGLLAREEAHPRASLFRLSLGRRCRFETRGLVVQIEGVAGEPAPLHLRPRLTRGDWIIIAISAVLHVAAIAALFVTNPSLP